MAQVSCQMFLVGSLHQPPSGILKCHRYSGARPNKMLAILMSTQCQIAGQCNSIRMGVMYLCQSAVHEPPWPLSFIPIAVIWISLINVCISVDYRVLATVLVYWSSFCLCAVGALLENESISGLSEGKPTGFRRTANAAEMVWTPDDLIAVVSWTFTFL